MPPEFMRSAGTQGPFGRKQEPDGGAGFREQNAGRRDNEGNTVCAGLGRTGLAGICLASAGQ